MTDARPAIKLLIIDDNPRDAELYLMQLRRAGFAVAAVTAADQGELRAALADFVPDVVLCDFSFPDFDGFAAQSIVRAACGDVPLIFVSGAITEDRAVLALQSGAVDYVLKSNLTRLPTAVDRAVTDARAQTSREERTRQHAERLEALWRIADHPDLRVPELIVEMMCEAETALRPGMTFQGILGTIEPGFTVVVCVGAPPAPDDPRVGIFQPGTRIALDQTIVPRAGRSQAWNDLADSADTATVPTLLGWRAMISTQFTVGTTVYSLSFASTEPAGTPFDSVDLSYIDVVAAAIAKKLQIDELEASLRAEEARSRRHAERLESLWRIVNGPSLRDAELWQAMLIQAAAGIRPGQKYWGLLWRIEDGAMVVEAVTATSTARGPLQTVGGVVPLEGTVIAGLLNSGHSTDAWDDLRDDPERSAYGREYGTRSLIVTTFRAGGVSWGLSFASTETTMAPDLGPLDRTYVEVLASFFQNRIQQRWQFERIAYEQSHDMLTGLLNRSQFRAQSRVASLTAGRFSIILIDVNGFREINQTYGHMIGDALLVEIGDALRVRGSAGEIVGRVGGNVFAVYVPDPPSPAHALERARSFAEIFARGFSTGDRDGTEFIARTASVGLAGAPEDGVKIEEIFSRAEAALSFAKLRGSGSIAPYVAGMESDAQRRATLRNELIDAVAHDEFTLHYQPHVEIATGAVTGCEALIRWNHPTRGLLAPNLFIPFAEETGIIAHIDEWVMNQAFGMANELGALRPNFRLYFNLSGRQAGDPKLVRAFADAKRRGVALEHIGVEITESDAMRDVESTRRVCRALRRLNVTIAIDDFGTGYSSLSSLKRLPVDVVKIDRSFISGVIDDPHDGAITEAIIGIADRFGFASLAEGAESDAEIAWLRERGCRYVQGYAIARPLPLAAFTTWMAARDAPSVRAFA